MEHLDLIKRNAERLLKEIPEGVILLAAAKTRTLEEVRAASEVGIRTFGHNYVQEAQAMIEQADFQGEWHMIGHLQRNKAGDAVRIFDMVQSLDSVRLANELEKRCEQQGKILPVLIEVNSGEEENKTGIAPDDVDKLVEALRGLSHLRLEGLMTMGPFSGDPELARPYFVKTRKIFESLSGSPADTIAMRYLSIGMSNSYRVAIEEGANMVRIGTQLFGPRSA